MTERSRHRADDLPTGEAKTVRVRAMFDAIAPRYDLLNRVIALGMDQGWRRRTVGALALAPGASVVDLACGTGDITRTATARGYRVAGVDFSWGMLSANAAGAPLVQGDATAMPLAEGSVDGIVCGYGLRNFTDLPAAMAEAARVLKPGGRLALLEISVPPSPLLRAGFRIWFDHVVPRLGSALSDAEAYHYLPRSTGYLPEADELRRLLVDVGFSAVGHRLFQGGLSQLFTATRAGMPSGAAAGP